MELSELLRKNDDEVNLLVSKQLRFILGIFLIVWLLNMKRVFIIDTYAFNKVMLLAAIFMMLPTILTDIMGIKYWLLKYVIILCSIMFVSACYIYLTYHVIIMFVFPIALAALYFDAKLTYVTVGASLIAMVVSHLLSIKFRLLSNDPFDVLYEVVVYGLMPRCIEYMAYSAIIIILARRTSKLLNKSISYGEYLQKSKSGQDIILSNTNALFKAKNEREVALVVFSSMKCLLSLHKKIQQDYAAYFGTIKSDGTYVVIRDTLTLSEVKRDGDRVKLLLDRQTVILPYFSDMECVMYFEAGYLILPFYDQRNLIAFCIIDNNFSSWTNTKMKQSVEILYGNIRLAVINLKLSRDMYQTQEELVRAFAEVCESKSRQTGQHIKRVSEYMKVMANVINLSDDETDNLVIASMMHDIGKLFVPSEILEKKDKLTDEEFDEIKKHVTYGYELLKSSPGRVMEIAKVVALQHHEKWNGKGYLGMKGKEIDYYSRIMAVVDVFDALVSKRSYKNKWSVTDAYDEIVRQSGEHFDPEIVGYFCKNFDRFKKIVKKYPD